ncbi:MAG: AAA family ATPase, partial [Bacteroidota bacterium]|nr:AAA family ATPase [Bacteroidota bacterium]MDX5429951.1 AAA family ATPase [Bacteroidota bacterium]MDX5468724.1 AAA family ATPase [Bacteroidota bacterium]
MFKGNPGTGKTTVARMLGKIYKQMGLLSKGHVHEVDRGDLVAEYIGQTAPKTKEAIKKARGGVLFIDEAYALARKDDDSKDFGREAIEVILKEMSDGPGDLAVVVAGYPDQMENFLNSNPGLKSRFTVIFDFPDYLPQELMEIAEYTATKKSVESDKGAEDFLYKKLVEGYRNRTGSFGNARFVNSLIDEAKMNLGLRIMQAKDTNKLTKKELSTIKLEDIERIYEEKVKGIADIPIDEDLLRESLGNLHAMVGLEKVKHEIDELVKLVRFYRETG